MNRWIAGGLLSALGLAGTAVFSAPSFADWSPVGGQREADMAPLDPLPGEQVTVDHSTCMEGTTDIWWALRPADAPGVVADGQAPLAEDGSWEVTFPAPDYPGDYLFFAVCLPPGATPPNVGTMDAIRSVEGAPAELLDDWGVDSVVYFAHLVPVAAPHDPTAPAPSPAPTDVGQWDPVPTTTVPVAPAATPVPGTPTFTG